MAKDRAWIVEGNEAFWIQDGCQLRTLGELVVALTFIPAEVYARFVDEECNDFAAWVEYSFGEKEVADAMRTNSEPEHMRQAVLASFGG